jgi:hypothetical protein
MCNICVIHKDVDVVFVIYAQLTCRFFHKLVLYGCETWSLTLREEHRLRRIFGSKRDEVTGDWRKLHNEELHNLYSLPNTIRMMKSMRMRLAGHVA